MPLYDFRCKSCAQTFEALVRPGQPATACPHCQSEDLEKLLSSFAVSSSERRDAAALKSRQKAAKIARADNLAMDREINEHKWEH
jgi:putative FmdB family regulatory protein